eukprot:jgi/Botrbrau1/6257/Bobra.0129s0009.1
MPTSGILVGTPNGACARGVCRQSFEVADEAAKGNSQKDPLIPGEEQRQRIIWETKHPNILVNFNCFTSSAKGKRVAVFLDYDGTLTPIVKEPDEAFMSPEMREVVRQIASLFPTAIISGRGRQKVQRFVQLDELYYAGSHGMDIIGPQERNGQICDAESPDLAYQPALEYLPSIHLMHDKLMQLLQDHPDSSLEDNKFCLSVHYRKMDPQHHHALINAVKTLVKRDHPELETKDGRKVVEVRPKIPWNKGCALKHLLDALGLLENDDVLPIYLGDDTTDEDAFEVLQNDKPQGLGILVSSIIKGTTLANYTLHNPSEVLEFLRQVVAWGRTEENAWHKAPSCTGWHLRDTLDGAESPLLPSAADVSQVPFEDLKIRTTALSNGPPSRSMGRPPRPFQSGFAGMADSSGEFTRQSSGFMPAFSVGKMSWEAMSVLQSSASNVSELPDMSEDTPPPESLLSTPDVTSPSRDRPESPLTPPAE